MDIFSKNNYHFIGIGGIGISAIAKMLVLQGKKVAGSDNSASEITEALQKIGVEIMIGQRPENIGNNVEIVIYTVAITEENPELIEARKRGLTCITYPQALGELSKQMYTIAIAGTHGKTTTTAMIGHILQEAGFDPTIVVGSKMIDSKAQEYTNFVAGKSKYLVVEACEYKRSFLNLSPSILVITNIEADHLDYYKDLADIQNAFEEIAQKVGRDGFIVTDPNHPNIEPVLKNVQAKVLDYTKNDLNIKLLVPGKHNILDAKASITATESLNIPKEKSENALKDFRGTWRRLEKVDEKDGNIFYTDYAHHPTEITASLSALKGEYPEHTLVCVFEPHQELRTKMFFDDFVESLKIADKVFIAPIYINKENATGVVTNQTLAEAVNKHTEANTVENAGELKREIETIKSDKPLCIVLMGAGNIYKWSEALIGK